MEIGVSSVAPSAATVGQSDIEGRESAALSAPELSDLLRNAG
jgi:hypothetical protein